MMWNTEEDEARRAFWERCCAATIPVYGDEELGAIPTGASIEEASRAVQLAFQMQARNSSKLADAKLAEWDKRWGSKGVAP